MTIHAAAVLAIVSLSLQLSPRLDALVDAVRPVLPFPAAAADGELPSDNSAASKWFVVWPATREDTAIVVKANPLHPETQKAGAEAMNDINAAVAAAERRAQAAYDKAMEQLRRTGKGGDLEVVTLDDEGVAGERIDAALEVRIELQDAVSFELASGIPPRVEEGSRGVQWVVRVAPNTYRATAGPDQREHFRAAEARLYFGLAGPPAVTRQADGPLFRVAVTPTEGAFAVVVRGNEELVTSLVSEPDWSRLRGTLPRAAPSNLIVGRREGASDVSNLRVEFLEYGRSRGRGAPGHHHPGGGADLTR